MNKKSKIHTSVPIHLTNNKTIYFKPLKAQSIIFISVGWLVLCYVLILSGAFYTLIDSLFSDYSSERMTTLVKFLLAPGAIGLAYGNALLAKGSQSLFWMRFIIGAIVILAISVWLVFPLSYLIQF